jgi:hypothetical protein
MTHENICRDDICVNNVHIYDEQVNLQWCSWIIIMCYYYVFTYVFVTFTLCLTLSKNKGLIEYVMLKLPEFLNYP